MTNISIVTDNVLYLISNKKLLIKRELIYIFIINILKEKELF